MNAICRRIVLTGLASIGFFAEAATAFAEDVTGASGAAQDARGETPALPNAPLPPSQPPPYQPGLVQPLAAEGRLRTGFNINGGPLAQRKAMGGVGGGTFRLGWQINRRIGAYGQLTHAMSWGSFVTQSLQCTPMFSVSPFDVLEVAAGPSLDFAAGTKFYVFGRTDGEQVEGFSGSYFGLHGRLALHLHPRLRDEKTGWRKGFTLGFDVHPTFGTYVERETIVSYTVGLGYDWM